jgi:hypothetical protein
MQDRAQRVAKELAQSLHGIWPKELFRKRNACFPTTLHAPSPVT